MTIFCEAVAFRAHRVDGAACPGTRIARERGVTIIELLVVVAIMGVVAGLGLPSFVDFIRGMRLAATMSDLSSDLMLARSEAIKRNARVLVCARASASSTSCTTSGSTTTWMNGWLVCYDVDSDGICDAGSSGDPNPLRVRKALDTPLSMTGPAAAVYFLPVGSANAVATFSMTGGSTASRSATISPSGSVTTSKSG